MGGYFGGRLAAQGVDVTFVARGAHLAAMRARGLRVESPAGDVHLPSVRVTDDPSAAGPADVVLFAVKLYDMVSALPMLAPLIGPETLVVPLQNGVEAVDAVTRTIGAAHTAGGTCYVSAYVSEPGVIRHVAMGRLIFGPLSEPAPRELQALKIACEGAGLETVLSDRIETEIWAKFVRLTAFSGVTTVTRCPIGVIAADPELRKLAAAALSESFAVANASGVPLDASVVPSIVESYTTMPFGTKSSMLDDLERGRRLELPFLSGKVAQLGQSLGVPTPIHQFITRVLGPFAHGARGRAES